MRPWLAIRRSQLEPDAVFRINYNYVESRTVCAENVKPMMTEAKVMSEKLPKIIKKTRFIQ